jgi:putative endonuclease
VSLFNKLLGKSGEDEAARFLTRQGYRVIERNFRTRTGEIDLIALHEGAVVFVEVKTRTSDAFGAPELAVTPQKQKRMIKAALGYMNQKRIHQMPCRFDIVAISKSVGSGIELIRNAFEVDPSRM